MKQTSQKPSQPTNLLRWGVGLFVAIAISLALAILFWPDQTGDQKLQQRPKNQRTVQKGKRLANFKKGAKRKKDSKKQLEERLPAEKEKPTINLDDDEYASLSSEMRSILEQLQEALDNDDAKSVSSICSRIQKIIQERGEDAVPVVVRENAVEALGLSLPHSLPELMGFMADGNADVREAVTSEIEDLFNDPSLGDRDFAPILKTLGTVVTDEDAIDAMITTLEDDLRNSIKVETYKQMLLTGTNEIKEKVRESINDLLERDEDDVPLSDKQLMESLDAYLKENPDDDDDNEHFGGDPDTDNDDN